MFKNMAVGRKITLGFAVVMVLLLGVGLAGYMGLKTASDGFSDYREMARDANLAGRLQANMLMVRMNVKDYLITGSDHDLKQFAEYWERMSGFQATAQKEIQAPERAAKIDHVEGELGKYKAGFEQVVAHMNSRNHDVNGVLNVKGPLMENTLTDIMLSAYDDADTSAAYYSGLAMKHLLLARLYMAKFLDTNDRKSVDRVHEEFGKMQKNLDILDRELQNPRRRQMLATVVEAKNTYTGTFTNLVDTIFKRNDIITDTLDRIGPVIAGDVEDVKLDIKGVQDKLGPALVASNKRSILLMAGIAAGAVILGIFLSLFITRSVTRPLNRVIEGLTQGAEQVSSASQQVSAGSQTLAEGSSQQAATIEETSASMEEMAAMTAKNSENAGQADTLMTSANQVVQTANDSMEQLTRSMEEISKASDETGKIIKTIDEIAFQTNLLALNAAVEAARAGEAGAGFAVVADEVRNLAMRAAEAAKDTAQLIEGTVKKVQEGAELVSTTNEAFEKVADSTGRVAGLVSEISEASREQSRGIDQVNSAIGEMDKVVQQNAANAEENASSSEEMSAQSGQMMGYIGELSTMVGQGNGSGYQAGAETMYIPSTPGNGNHPVVPSRKRRPAGSSGREVLPEQVIPLDEDEFRDF